MRCNQNKKEIVVKPCPTIYIVLHNHVNVNSFLKKFMI